MRKRKFGTLPVAAALAAAGFAGDPAQAQSLPGDASSMRESHADWLVTCVARDGQALCAMAQTQADPRTRKRILALELQVTPGETVTGTLLMPFGLALGDGVSLKVDEGAGISTSAFSTCLPAGCVVPLVIDAALVSALKTGTTLHVDAVANGNGEKLTFAISLDGFSRALARLAELVR